MKTKQQQEGPEERLISKLPHYINMSLSLVYCHCRLCLLCIKTVISHAIFDIHTYETYTYDAYVICMLYYHIYYTHLYDNTHITYIFYKVF